MSTQLQADPVTALAEKRTADIAEWGALPVPMRAQALDKARKDIEEIAPLIRSDERSKVVGDLRTRRTDDLAFSVGQLQGALGVLRNPSVPIDRDRLASLLAAIVGRLHGFDSFLASLDSCTEQGRDEEQVKDTDDPCTCGHVRHEHRYFPDPECGPETGRCVHCECERFELAETEETHP